MRSLFGGIALAMAGALVSPVYGQQQHDIAMAEPAAAEPLANGNLSGTVFDAETKETLVGATVLVKGTKLGAYTNKLGLFSLRNVPLGKQTLVVSYLGYAKKEVPVEITETSRTPLRIELQKSSVQTQVVEVDGNKQAEKRQISISKVDIPVEQLKQIRIGGEADIFRSLQYLPGVLTASQISSGLFVRGGSPDQNLVLIDGQTVYNPSHLFGFISAFNSDAVKDVELLKGGFPAEYGGRMSAVLSITQIDGNKEEVEGIAALGLLSSRLALQGPIGNGSWFISARRTYLDLLLGLVPEDPDNPLPDFAFYDINAKVTQDLGDHDRIFASFFTSADDLNFGGEGIDFGIGIGNRSGSLRWSHIFADNLFSELTLSGSRYRNGFSGDNLGFQVEANNYITDYTAKGSMEWFTTEALTVKGGFEITNFRFQYYQNFSGRLDSNITPGENVRGRTNIEEVDWVHAAFGQINYQFSDLFSVQAGLRASLFDRRNITVIDPRLAMRWQIQENLAMKLSWGIFHQYLRLASNPNFTFFDTWLPTDESVDPGRAIHYIASFETKPSDEFDLNVDAYYKVLNNINEVNTFNNQAGRVADIFYQGNGTSYGAEIFLQKKSGRLTGWLGYGLGWITARFDSINGGREFRPFYDRRHDFKVVAQYKIDDRWEIGSSFFFQSGQSYTGRTSRWQNFGPGEQIGRGITVPSERNGLRLPPSHQLNINANYTTTLFGLPCRLLIDIYNVYSRRDIFFRFYDTTQEETEVRDVRLLPIIPTLSIELKF